MCIDNKISFISDWIHFVILEMSYLKNFVFDSNNIKKRLRSSLNVTDYAISSAIDRLLRFRFIRRNLDGSYEKTPDQITAGEDTPNSAIQKYHSQILDLAKNSLTEVSIKKRDIAGTQ